MQPLYEGDKRDSDCNVNDANRDYIPQLIGDVFWNDVACLTDNGHNLLKGSILQCAYHFDLK